MHKTDEALSQLLNRFTLFAGPLDNLVIDIRDITNIGNIETRCPQVAHHDIKDHQNTGMPEMTIVVDRHSTDIDTYLARLDRDERFLFLAQTVVDPQHSGFIW